MLINALCIVSFIFFCLLFFLTFVSMFINVSIIIDTTTKPKKFKIKIGSNESSDESSESIDDSDLED